MAEEAELRRLEGWGGASPREPVVPAPSSSPPSCASFGVAEGEERVIERVLASPALAVKAGRERGLSVLARKQKAEAEQIAAEEAAAAAKRGKRPRRPERQRQSRMPQRTGGSVLLAGRQVAAKWRGHLGSWACRGEHATQSCRPGDGVQALQERRQSLLAKADFRPMRAVILQYRWRPLAPESLTGCLFFFVAEALVLRDAATPASLDRACLWP
ncbi:hypothetical protein OAO87_03360 [bacterium]|nr:hypothetical protein [bacterium]